MADWSGALAEEMREIKCADKEVTVMQVIRTTNLRRGDGVNTPIRSITQFWSMQGDLLAEVDPLSGMR